MVEHLHSIGFKSSLVDECVFYRDDVIFIVYVDDGIFISGDGESITKAICDITDSGLEIEDQGHPTDYVGVSIKKHRNGYYEFTQRALIDTIINDVNIGDAYTKPLPAKSSTLLQHHKDSPAFSECGFHFGYRSVTGKLNYLAQTTRPDIMFAVHQIAKFSSDPRKEHGEAVIYLVRYLKKTRDLALDLSLTLFVDLSVTVTLTFLVTGVPSSLLMTQVLQSHVAVGSFSTPHAPSSSPAKSNASGSLDDRSRVHHPLSSPS
jgi:hypothetical protein